MKHNRKGMGRKTGALLLALTLAAMLPLMALAEAATDTAAADATGAATAQTGGGMPQQGGGMRGQGMGMQSSQTLTADQQTAYDAALALYRQVEDAVLADLVATGTVTQADVDAYTAQREASGELDGLDGLDTSTWTALQYKAYYEALQKTGEERTAAVQALADAGQLTQAQAEALTSNGTDGLWQRLTSNAGTNTAVQTAVETLHQASQTLRKTLRDAGINGLAKRDSIGSLGQNGAAGGIRPQDGQQGMPGSGNSQRGGMGGNQHSGRGVQNNGMQNNDTQNSGSTSPADN